MSIAVVAFDAYGTLLDVNSAVAACADVLGPHTAAIGDLWRRKQLEYTWLRSLMGRHADFQAVTADALAYALDAFAIRDPELTARLLALYDDPAPCPSAVEAVSAARAACLQTCVLSNGTDGMLRRALSGAGLLERLDAVLSVDAVGIYKPDPRVYGLVGARFGVPPDAVAFVSANGWDAAGAAAFGFRVVWVNRTAAPVERLAPSPAAVIDDLSTLPAVLEALKSSQAGSTI